MNVQVLQQRVIWTSCSLRIMRVYVFLVSKAANLHAYLLTVALLVGVHMPYTFYEVNLDCLRHKDKRKNFRMACILPSLYLQST